MSFMYFKSYPPNLKGFQVKTTQKWCFFSQFRIKLGSEWHPDPEIWIHGNTQQWASGFCWGLIMWVYWPKYPYLRVNPHLCGYCGNTALYFMLKNTSFRCTLLIRYTIPLSGAASWLRFWYQLGLLHLVFNGATQCTIVLQSVPTSIYPPVHTLI